MRAFLYYALMLLLGYAWYRYGQKLLRKGYRDEKGELTQGLVGPVGFLLTAGVTCYLFFAMLRALVRGEVPCVGKGCVGQVYTGPSPRSARSRLPRQHLDDQSNEPLVPGQTLRASGRLRCRSG